MYGNTLPSVKDMHHGVRSLGHNVDQVLISILSRTSVSSSSCFHVHPPREILMILEMLNSFQGDSPN